MNVQDIIGKALIDYDTAQPVIKYLLQNAYYEGTKPSNELERTRFTFIDKETNKVILDTEIETLAVYYDKLKVWSWAWSQTGLRNAENYLAKEILIYSLKLESGLSYIKSILTTSRGIIRDATQLDINLAIGSSIIKQPYIYPYYYKMDEGYLVYYIILLNKTDLDNLNSLISSRSAS